MRRLTLLIAVSLVVPLLGSDSSRKYDDKILADNLEGTWQLSEIEIKGEKFPTNPVTLTLRGGTCTLDDGDDGVALEGTYRIDPARNPPHLDLFPSNKPQPGQNLIFIYQSDGKTLRTAHSVNDWPRPRDFKGDGVVVEIYNRVK